MTLASDELRKTGESAILSYRHVGKKFGDFVALDSISFDVFPGEVIFFIGPSGSGKSTLLRGTNALDRFDNGELYFKGKPLPKDETQMRIVRRHMGMVFQNFELFPYKTAIENIMTGPMTVLRHSRGDAEIQARALLDKVGLSDKADHYPANLSGGQQQRVAIARALAMQPDILLFDEPTSALDPETIGEVLQVMKALADEGRTMIVVTHEMNFARKVADWVVVFENGRILEQGSPLQIFENPQIERTKTFLSHLNWHE